MDVATDGVREGEIGCLFDEIQNLVEPIERLDTESLGRAAAKPWMVKRSGPESRLWDAVVERVQGRTNGETKRRIPGQTKNSRSDGESRPHGRHNLAHKQASMIRPRLRM
jgi:hypothetical protein